MTLDVEFRKKAGHMPGFFFSALSVEPSLGASSYRAHLTRADGRDTPSARHPNCSSLPIDIPIPQYLPSAPSAEQ